MAGENTPASIENRKRNTAPIASAIPPTQTDHCDPIISSIVGLGLGGAFGLAALVFMAASALNSAVDFMTGALR